MIIYNITINIENDIKEEWIEWMKNSHIPQVMNTGCFIENKMCRVLVDEEQGTTFSVQYTSKTMQDYETYKQIHAPQINKEIVEKYGHKMVAFRTLLEII